MPKYRVVPTPSTKIHRIRYLAIKPGKDISSELLAVSTEDGRIIFYSKEFAELVDVEDKSNSIPKARAYAEVGGKLAGVSGRVKDFEVFSLVDELSHEDKNLIVACGSDGAVRVWSVAAEAFDDQNLTTAASKQDLKASSPPQVGKLLGVYETGNRITCMVAFLMQKSEGPSMLSESESDGNEQNGAVEESSTDDSEY
jgi:protein MAK11